MSLRTVESGADVGVAVTAHIQHRCPFMLEVDEGTVTVAWRCAGQTIELHALRTWLDGFKDAELSHEALTDLVRHELGLLDGITDLRVASTWQTAGMEVTCSTSPTPAGRTP